MSTPNQEMLEVFLQEASEHLQFLREYSSVLQDPYPAAQDLERLYVAAHTLVGSSGLYQFKLFAEVASKLAHIFQYAINAGISQEASGPLVEFIYEGIAVLESDLLMVSTNGVESEDEFQGFKEKYPYAFQSTETAKEPEPVAAPDSERHPMPPASWEPEPLVHETQEPTQVALPTFDEPAPVIEETRPVIASAAIAEPTPISVAVPAPAATAPAVRVVAPVRKPEPPKIEIPDLAPDDEVPAEVLEFFVPEVEEHIQAVTDCLLSLEANPNPEDIHRLFRAMHTIKGSAAQVGLHRISRVAHRAEDLIGRLRDGELRPSASIVDICLESVDALKKFLYNQWPDEATLQTNVKSLLTRIANLAPEEQEEGSAPAAVEEARQLLRWKISSGLLINQRPLFPRLRKYIRSNRLRCLRRNLHRRLPRLSSFRQRLLNRRAHLSTRKQRGCRAGSFAGSGRDYRRFAQSLGWYAAVEVGAYRSRAPGPNDERGRRTGDQPHAHVRARG